MYFINAFLATCGIAAGIPVLFIAQRISARYFPEAKNTDLNRRSVELMEERNRLDSIKAECLERIAAMAERQGR